MGGDGPLLRCDCSKSAVLEASEMISQPVEVQLCNAYDRHNPQSMVVMEMYGIT